MHSTPTRHQFAAYNTAQAAMAESQRGAPFDARMSSEILARGNELDMSGGGEGLEGEVIGRAQVAAADLEDRRSVRGRLGALCRRPCLLPVGLQRACLR